MKSFVYKHSAVVLVMLSVIFVISAVGIYFNVANAIDVDVTAKKISYAVLAAICILLDATVLSIVFFSRYSVKGSALTVRMGFFRVKHDARQISALVHVKKNDKLVAQFSDGSFAAIVISPKFYDEFFKAVKEVNPALIYSLDYGDGEDEEN